MFPPHGDEQQGTGMVETRSGTKKRAAAEEAPAELPVRTRRTASNKGKIAAAAAAQPEAEAEEPAVQSSSSAQDKEHHQAVLPGVKTAESFRASQVHPGAIHYVPPAAPYVPDGPKNPYIEFTRPLFQYIVFPALCIAWVAYTTPEQKLRATVFASIYSCIEFTCTSSEKPMRSLRARLLRDCKCLLFACTLALSHIDIYMC